MNKILLVGRLVKDPELKLYDNDKKVSRFTLAVERSYKEATGERKCDFIPICVWGRRAEVVQQYLHKGSLITLSGRLRTSVQEDENGNRRYMYEVVGEDFKFSETISRKEA